MDPLPGFSHRIRHTPSLLFHHRMSIGFNTRAARLPRALPLPNQRELLILFPPPHVDRIYRLILPIRMSIEFIIRAARENPRALLPKLLRISYLILPIRILIRFIISAARLPRALPPKPLRISYLILPIRMLIRFIIRAARENSPGFLLSKAIANLSPYSPYSHIDKIYNKSRPGDFPGRIFADPSHKRRAAHF